MVMPWRGGSGWSPAKEAERGSGMLPSSLLPPSGLGRWGTTTVRPRRRDDSREASTSRPDRTATMDPYSRVGSDTMARIRYDRLPTERPNPRSRGLDRLGPGEIARLMNRADADAVRAVGRAAPAIGRAGAALRERP